MLGFDSRICVDIPMMGNDRIKIVSFPLKKWWIFHSYVNVYQRV
jgi:hypothetical protein